MTDCSRSRNATSSNGRCRRPPSSGASWVPTRRLPRSGRCSARRRTDAGYFSRRLALVREDLRGAEPVLLRDRRGQLRQPDRLLVGRQPDRLAIRQPPRAGSRHGSSSRRSPTTTGCKTSPTRGALHRRGHRPRPAGQVALAASRDPRMEDVHPAAVHHLVLGRRRAWPTCSMARTTSITPSNQYAIAELAQLGEPVRRGEVSRLAST